MPLNSRARTLRRTIEAKLPPFVAANYLQSAGIILAEEGKRLNQTLSARSPVGASKELSKGWQVSPPKRAGRFQIDLEIFNTARNATERLLGRGPGRMPPIAPLVDWVIAKFRAPPSRAQGIAYAIALKIAREGTERWRKQENPVGISPDGKIKSGSPVDLTYQRITKRIKQLTRR